ncbi:ATP-dependent Clp protease ATP-binding subunit CLPT1, chloroplastic [Sesamum angolense]|uniref:ATP-dependent Clp protease ATP-binding subunit CLPT1, chloroplastic n=1 Tax=Sesamum angolense TaxID=2727404 RepID=A0AAE1W1N4_9LAMI|nr:ATP-dependent Clp protease ATP-binding subunit CLPT1, chloroplastic [Sesamum angolense]
MAAQGLSVFPITPSSSATGQSCRSPFCRSLSFNLSILGTKAIDSRPQSDCFETTWSARLDKVELAELEARSSRTSLAAKFLRENGVTLFKVREETVKLLGKSDLYFFSPEHPPLTEPAQRALNWAVEEKLKSVTKQVKAAKSQPRICCLEFGRRRESAGHKILATLGFDDDKAKELSKTVSSLPHLSMLSILSSRAVPFNRNGSYPIDINCRLDDLDRTLGQVLKCLFTLSILLRCYKITFGSELLSDQVGRSSSDN